MLECLRFTSRRAGSRRRRPDVIVSEPDPRAVMAALALGLVVGAFTGGSSDPADGAAAAEPPEVVATLDR